MAKRFSIVCLILLVFVFYSLLRSAAPAMFHSPSGKSHAGGETTQRFQGIANTIKKAFQWEDINSAKVVERSEDKIIIDGKVPFRKFRIDLLISPQKLEKAINSFGIPYSWLRIKYKNQEELQHKQTNLIAQAAARGISFVRTTNAFGADYVWIIDQSRADVGEVVAKLSKEAKEAEYDDERAVLGLFASFVQTLPYKEQPVSRTSADGSALFVAGVTMPLETLANGFGDCDTKCLLFGSLISLLKGQKFIFLRGGGHVFVGIQIVLKPKDRYVRLKNVNYVLVELTSPWLLGHIPGESWRGLQAKKFEVIPLTGN